MRDELDAVRRELEQLRGRVLGAAPAGEDESIIARAIGIMEALRQVVELRTVQRWSSGSLDDQLAERLGESLSSLQRELVELARAHGMEPGSTQLRGWLPLEDS